MKRKDKIASALIGLGALGIIGFADTLNGSATAFLLTEGVCFALALLGVALQNTKAGAEAPADIMNNGKNRNS